MMIRKTHRGMTIGLVALTLLFLAQVLAHAGESPSTGGTHPAITVSSSAFQAGGSIPAKYTCDGGDSSPPLRWTGVPSSAKSLALVCDDPDAPAGTWTHWVLYDLPSAISALDERLPVTATLPNGARQGLNDFQRIGYGGPCPPPGKPHRYFFKLYALDIQLKLKPGASKGDVLRTLESHIVAEGQLMGTYQRKR